MRIKNFNDPVSMPNGHLTTLEEMGGSPLAPATHNTLGGVMIGDGVNVDDTGVISVTPMGLTVETFQSDATPKTLTNDGLLVIINHGDNTSGTVTVTTPNWGNYTATMSNHNVVVFPIKAGSTVSIVNDSAKRNTFFYYH